MIGEILTEIFQLVVIRIFLYGLIFAIATPFVLISAPFRKSGVRGGYAAVADAFENVF